jgi:hypothetical protein
MGFCAYRMTSGWALLLQRVAASCGSFQLMQGDRKSHAAQTALRSRRSSSASSSLQWEARSAANYPLRTQTAVSDRLSASCVLGSRPKSAPQRDVSSSERHEHGHSPDEVTQRDALVSARCPSSQRNARTVCVQACLRRLPLVAVRCTDQPNHLQVVSVSRSSLQLVEPDF